MELCKVEFMADIIESVLYFIFTIMEVIKEKDKTNKQKLLLVGVFFVTIMIGVVVVYLLNLA